MKKFLASTLVATMISSAAFAGGPVVVVEEAPVVAEASSPRSGWIVPVIVGLVLICAVACGSDDDEPAATPAG